MVSDQCQALVRDNVVECQLTEKTKVFRRKTKEDEMIPSLLVENKEMNEIDILFFLISIQNGFPLEKTRDQVYIKYSDYPINPEKVKSQADLNAYKMKKRAPQDEYSDFHFLLAYYLSKDKNEAIKCAKCIANNQPTTLLKL